MKAECFLPKIRDSFPQLEWQKHRVLTHGWDHIVIVLDNKIVFRFPKDKKYRDQFQDEIRLLHHLKKRIEVGIPEYNYVSEDRSFAGYDMLGGRELTCSRFRRLPAADKDAVAGQLAGFISTLHTTPQAVITKCSVTTENHEQVYQDLVRDTRELLFPRFRNEDIQLVEEYFGGLRDALSHDYSHVLTHNDLTSEHILWDSRSKRINIIDFSDRALGDPAGDLAGLLVYGADFTEKVFGLYSGKRDDWMLSRARLYFRRIPLLIMIASMRGFPCTFEQGYTMYKERFKA